MNKNTAPKLPRTDTDLSSNTNRTSQLFVRKKESPVPARETDYKAKRFRGDLLVYFIAVGIWLFGTVWMVIRLIDSFF